MNAAPTSGGQVGRGQGKQIGLTATPRETKTISNIDSGDAITIAAVDRGGGSHPRDHLTQ